MPLDHAENEGVESLIKVGLHYAKVPHPIKLVFAEYARDDRLTVEEARQIRDDLDDAIREWERWRFQEKDCEQHEQPDLTVRAGIGGDYEL